MRRRLLVATQNKGKVEELSEMLGGLDVDLLGLDDVGINSSVKETGTTFSENAVLKARTYASQSGLLTLADDSGLEVDALGGEPGVHTARFGGEGLTPIERYQLLLRLLQHVPWEDRSARFRCVVALATPAALVTTTQGTIEGHIAWKPAGTGGFGYDPIFYVNSKGVTMAELAPEIKNRISHRGRAIAEMRPILRAELDR